MGYIHDTHVAVLVPSSSWYHVTGTWAAADGTVTGNPVMTCTLGDNTAVVTVPMVGIIQNSSSQKGWYLTSIDIWFATTVAALDAMSALIHLTTLPADGAAMPAVSAQTFTYDTGNDSAAERLEVDEKKMTLTLTTPIWMDDDSYVTVQLTFDGAANSVVKTHVARFNGTLRL